MEGDVLPPNAYRNVLPGYVAESYDLILATRRLAMLAKSLHPLFYSRPKKG